MQIINHLDPNHHTGWVYALTHPAMPGLVKIGMTLRGDIQSRIDELGAATGVPGSFSLLVAFRVCNPRVHEAEMHRRYHSRRVDSGREFFYVTNDKVAQDLYVYFHGVADICCNPRQIKLGQDSPMHGQALATKHQKAPDRSLVRLQEELSGVPYSLIPSIVAFDVLPSVYNDTIKHLQELSPLGVRASRGRNSDTIRIYTEGPEGDNAVFYLLCTIQTVSTVRVPANFSLDDEID